MKPRLKPREFVWMTLPVVFIAGIVWLIPWARRLKGGPPVGLEVDQPRIELENWTHLKPSVVEIARGLSAKVEVTAWQGGQCPASAGSTTSSLLDFPRSLELAFLRHGKWETIPFDYSTSGMDFRHVRVPMDNRLIRLPGSQEQNNKGTYVGDGRRITMNIPVGQVPHDATEVRLRGRLKGTLFCSGPPTYITIQSPPIDVVLKAPTESWPVANSQRSDLQFLRAEQKPVVSTSTSLYRDTVQVTASFDFKHDSSFRLQSDQSWIEDASTKHIQRVATGQCGTNYIPLQSGVGMRTENNCTWAFNTTHLRGQAPFTLKAWVSIAPDRWPLLVKIPLSIKSPKPSR